MSLIGAFWAVSLLFVVTPGADWAYAIGAGIRNSSVVPAVAGLLGAQSVVIAAVAAGVAAVIAGEPHLMTVLTAAGAGYLIWLGVGTIRAPAEPEVDGQAADASLLRQIATGFGVSGLNPKVFLLFLALLPQFTDTDGAWPVTTQILVLGAAHLVSCAVVYLAVGTGARLVVRAKPAAARVVSRVSGVAMVGVGALLLVDQVVT